MSNYTGRNADILHYSKKGPRLLYYLARAPKPEPLDTSRELFDLLSSYEPMYRLGTYESWKERAEILYARDLEHYQNNGLVIRRLGVDKNADADISVIEQKSDFVRWVRTEEPTLIVG